MNRYLPRPKVNGSGQMKRQKDLISPQPARPGRISKDYGASACWKGVPEVEVLWHIGLANSEDRASVGCVRKGPNTINFKIRPHRYQST